MLVIMGKCLCVQYALHVVLMIGRHTYVSIYFCIEMNIYGRKLFCTYTIYREMNNVLLFKDTHVRGWICCFKKH